MTTSFGDTTLVTFKALNDFVLCLEEVFGSKQRPLKLYMHLLQKTTLGHTKAIQKHIQAFHSFCSRNREALETRNPSKFKSRRISYSERVYIDIGDIFKKADRETTIIIWRHLLTISALVDPASKARTILNSNAVNNDSSTEASFLTNIIDRVEEHVDPNANPMDAVASIMQSGVFTDLVGGMGQGIQDGSLDLGKLMGTVQTMVSGLTSELQSGNPTETGLPDISSTSRSNALPGSDLNSVMDMVSPLLGALQLSGGKEPQRKGSITEQIDAQVLEARKNGRLPAITEDATASGDGDGDGGGDENGGGDEGEYVQK